MHLKRKKIALFATHIYVLFEIPTLFEFPNEHTIFCASKTQRQKDAAYYRNNTLLLLRRKSD